MAKENFLVVDHLSLQELTRIFSKITVNPFTQCWEWTGERIRDGYGRWRFRGRKELIHRILYAWTTEPLRRGHGGGIPELDHVICDNRGCANPAHVRLGSHRANALRSGGISAINAAKTHCLRGHELPVKGNRRCDGGRYCKVCASEYGKKRWAEKRAAKYV